MGASSSGRPNAAPDDATSLVGTEGRLDAFKLRDEAVGEYRSYVESFVTVADPRVRAEVERTFDDGMLWPDPWIQINPKFSVGAKVTDLSGEGGLLHDGCTDVFSAHHEDGSATPFSFYHHQVEAFEAAEARDNYVMTTGTGSGKSLTYIVPIVDRVLREGTGKGIRAIIVYPMNALANSQIGELEKFLPNGNLRSRYDKDSGLLDNRKPSGPVTFARYTGQDEQNFRNVVIENPPDILLTNYVMLEMILTRVYDRRLVNHAPDLAFLVLDELHTYRGRQGADVALLLRRLAEATRAPNVQYVGTSATMASGGSRQDQRAAVANVATTLFGSEVKADRVIGETLERVTRGDLPTPTRSDVDGFTSPATFDDLAASPLAGWVEDQVGVEQDETGTLRRAQPQQLPTLAETLSDVTGAPYDRCVEVVRETILGGDRLTDPSTDKAAFAFRLHQFVSRGSSVLATLQTEQQRVISMEEQQYAPGTDRRMRLFPLGFCRECGQDYYPVERVKADGGQVRYYPRDIGDRQGSHDGELGFLHISAADPWPSHAEGEVLERIPADWVEEGPDGLRVERYHRGHLPKPVSVNGLGEESHVEGVDAHFVPRPFRFCLSCGVNYSVGSDMGKLGSMGIEGRSTATTMLTLSTIRHLRALNDVEVPAKLLNFTDNRQDASLQAGHFNDFAQVGLLRSAIYQAAVAAGDDGIGSDDIEQQVEAALTLDPADYTPNPDAKYSQKRKIDEAFREALRYRIFHDLRGGWRITAPNLENVGLLRIDYADLPDIAADDGLWADPRHLAGAAAGSPLVDATAQQREQICRVLLDWMRRDLAIEVGVLNPERQEVLKNKTYETLLDPWRIDEQEQLAPASAVVPRSKIKRGKGVKDPDPPGWKYATPASAFGKWIRRHGFDDRDRLTTDQTQAAISHLLAVLSKDAGLVAEGGVAADGAPLYRVSATAMRWVAGDGSPQRDLLRVPRPPKGGEDGSVNRFFRQFYAQVAETLAGVKAAEHTAQIGSEDRELREDAFRADPPQLDALFCSPTMELGIDIANLNVVGMRNVPPTPANYAQRSGRAGRSGQAAFVFTYCSTGSAHDQFYFQRPVQMVSGQVAAPRIDLANEDLVRAHVQAVWLAATETPIKASLGDVLTIEGDAHDPDIGLDPDLEQRLQSPAARKAATTVAREVLGRIDGLDDAVWWHDDWVDRVVAEALDEFKAATGRWQGLYRAAVAQIEQQHRIANDHARRKYERDQARRARQTAERQRDLLLAKDDGTSSFNSDFYSYRYFAAEGFLPGYSFPRLPLSAYLPGRRSGRGNAELLNRPRFIAVAEFGPHTSIYHNGDIYKVDRAMLPIDADTMRDGGEARLLVPGAMCRTCGHLHRGEEAGRDISQDLCVNCKTLLGTAIEWHNLFRMTSVSTRRVERINSNEEERNRAGFELRTGFTFATRDGVVDRTAAHVETADGQQLLGLTYGHTATLTRINLGWRRRPNDVDHGFWLNIEDGRWMGKPPEADGEDGEPPPTGDDPAKQPVTKVVPFVEDRRNTLVVRPDDEVLPDNAKGSTPEAMLARASFVATLQAAFRVAIQELYQLEDSELAAEPLPSDTVEERDSFLLYEAAEGGAGVLRLLVDRDHPDAISEVAVAALERMHYDPADGWADLGRAAGRRTDCVAACYDCLMSYGNQRDHALLDRTDEQGVKTALMALTGATVVIDCKPAPAATQGNAGRGSGQPTSADTDPWQPLHNGTSSQLEAKLLELARERGHRPPDAGQRRIDEVGCVTDFLYVPDVGKPTAVFVDGPHHDDPAQQATDQGDTEALQEFGYRVIRFPCHKDEPWERTRARWSLILDEYQTIFGKAAR